MRARLKGELWTLPLLSRKRTCSDGFALEIRSAQPSQLVWNAKVTARGGRMRGPCGALPGNKISREPRVPHRAAEGRFLDTSLLMEERIVHELFCGAH